MKSNTLWVILGIIALILVIYAVSRIIKTTNIKSGAVSGGAGGRKLGTIEELFTDPSNQVKCPEGANISCEQITVSTPNGPRTGCKCIVVGRNSPQFYFPARTGATPCGSYSCPDGYHCVNEAGHAPYCAQDVVKSPARFSPTVTTVISHSNGNPAMNG